MKKILLLLAAAAVFLLIGIAASLLMTRMRPKNDSSVSSGMLSGAAVSAAGISAADASAIGISAADASVSGISAAASQADVSVIPASEAVPDSKTSETSDLSAVSSPAAQADLFCDTSSLYTYDEMASDLNALSQSYSDLLTLGSLGQTPDGRELYHAMVPFIRSTSFLTMASPRPLPVSKTLSVSLENGSYMTFWNSGSMPFPLSEMTCVHTAFPPISSMRLMQLTLPPSGVYLTALDSRFRRIC